MPDDMTLGIQSLSARFVFTLAHIFSASLLLFLGFLAVGATRWQLDTLPQGSNLIPIIFFSVIVILVGVLAILPKLAPPVIPMALISIIGWIWLLLSGTIPIR